MPQTPLGITYPDAGDHTRLWEHFQTLATDVDGLIDPAGDATRPWTFVAQVTLSATNGRAPLVYGSGSRPPGHVWAANPSPSVQMRSNTMPGFMWLFAVGNLTTTTCDVFIRRSDTNAAADGPVPALVAITGLVVPAP